MEKLEENIRQFYEAILHSKDLPSPYDKFPSGCCQDASWILHRHLFEKGYITVELVGGEYHGDNGEYMSHAWLEFDGTIIDITYSQFNEVNALSSQKNAIYIKSLLRITGIESHTGRLIRIIIHRLCLTYSIVKSLKI